MLDDVTTPLDLTDRGIGIDHIPLTPMGFLGNASNVGEFRDAYRRGRAEAGASW